MTDREIMQQAFDLLCDAVEPTATQIQADIGMCDQWDVDAIKCIDTLRQALAQPEFDTPESHIVKWSIPVDPNNFGEPLAQPEQEPVAWAVLRPDGRVKLLSHQQGVEVDLKWTPLYTAPPRKPWQGLTSEDWENTPDTGKQGCERDCEIFDWIEQTLKDKNDTF